MISIKINNRALDLDAKARYRLDLKMPLPGGELEYSSTPFFDLPDTDNNREALMATPVLSDSGRYRTYAAIISLAGMDLKGTMVVTSYAKTMRACISLRSFAVDVEKGFNEVGYPRMCCTTNADAWPLDGYGYLPSLYNPGLYGDGDSGSNPGFGGVVNWFDSSKNKFYENQPPVTDDDETEGYNTYSRSVFPLFARHYKRALGGEKVTVNGSFFDDDDINSLIMYSHATSDFVVSNEPLTYQSAEVYPYKNINEKKLVAFNSNLVTLSWGVVGTSCRVYKPGYLRMTMTVNTPDGVFSFRDDFDPPTPIPELMPDFGLDCVNNEDGTTTLTWFGFLEMREHAPGPAERSLAIWQTEGTPFSSGSVKFEFYEKYLLNRQGDIDDFSAKILKSTDVLPNLSIAEAITATSTMFCTVPLVHPATGDVQVNFMSHILRGKTIDISHVAGQSIEIEPNPPKKHVFSFDYPSDSYCGEESFKDISARKIIEVNSFFEAPAVQANRYLIDKSTLGVYQAVENEETKSLEWKWYTDLGGQETWDDEWTEEEAISTKCTPLVNQIVTAPSGAKFMAPACKMEGISPYYKIDNRDVPLRLMHWIGWGKDTAGAKYPFATSGQRDMFGNIIKPFSLMWGGSNGLISTFWMDWLEYKNYSEKVTVTLHPDDSELYRLISIFLPQPGHYTTHDRFMRTGDVKMLPAEMVVEFTPDTITGVQIKAIRCVTSGSVNTY